MSFSHLGCLLGNDTGKRRDLEAMEKIHLLEMGIFPRARLFWAYLRRLMYSRKQGSLAHQTIILICRDMKLMVSRLPLCLAR